ncbi:WcbI family polysaccharide biosynthesis putative acetyltransferase [Herbiconiux sp. P18]|uniref:WcbI family polysaccharide biosynthesis putative acetyltransferase n=1 Tax=Herbiconiux liangxiaofengii TaxID=3342795 RepID=UPI0035B84520
MSSTGAGAGGTAVDEGRRAHYAEFYSRPEQVVDAGEPVMVAVGNCQAESLRLVVPAEALRSVRIPPVHELTADDVPHLQAWLGRADVVSVQPIRDGYHGLPLGTRELLAVMRPEARAAVVPVIRFAGLYPRHLIVRPPSDPSLTPPLVAYHDAAVLAEAAGLRLPALTPARVRAVAAESVQALRSREERHGAIAVSDLFEAAAPDAAASSAAASAGPALSFELMRTVNHPGNPVWIALADRLLERVGVDARASDGGRPLLDSVHAPREQAVIDAFGLDAEPRADWAVEGEPVSADAVREAHLAWYAEHPDVVPAGLARHESTLRLLGLTS